MAPPPEPGPPAWSMTLRLRSCGGGLDLRLAAANVLPGLGRGGERLSLLLRLRRRLRLRLSVASQCHHRAPPAKPKKPCISNPLRFLGLKWLKKAPKPLHWAPIQDRPSWCSLRHDRRRPTMLLTCFVVILASTAAFRFMIGNARVKRGVMAHVASWGYFSGKHIVKFLAPLLYEWVPKFSFLK